MVLRILAVSFLLFTSIIAFGQTTEIDSLFDRVATARTAQEKVQLLNSVVTKLRDIDMKRAFRLAQESVEIAEQINFNEGLCVSLENLAWILYRRNDFSKSLETASRALKIAEEVNDKSCAAKCLINIAAIQFEKREYDKSIETLRRVIVIAKSNNDASTLARTHDNMAYFYLEKRDLDSAEVNARKAIEISEVAGEKYLTSFGKRVLGDVSFERKDYGEALRLYNESLAIAININNNFLKASTLLSVAMAHNALGETDRALKYLQEDIKIARAEGFREELEDAYKAMSELYYKRNDLKNAYLYQSKYVGVHDTIVNEKSSEQLAMMQTAFETELKQAQIELLTKDAALKAEEIRHQRIWTYIYIGGLALLASFIFILGYSNLQTNRAKRLLEEKNREIEKKTLDLKNLNSTKDKLFSIISHDLRSPIAGLRGLTEIVSSIGLTQEEFTLHAGLLRRNLDSVYDDLDTLLLWARTQLNGLHASPENVDVGKVATEKIELFKDQAKNKGIALISEIAENTFVYADKNHVHLVLRNLIANAIKFSKAGGTVKLTAAEDNGYFRISVIDSGIGLSSEDIQKLFNTATHFTRPGTNKEKGLGLGLMLSKEFVESNSGRIWVASEPGKGATFSFTLRAGES